jgi:hypothetical protein
VVVASTEQQLDVVVPAVPAPFNLLKAPIVVRTRDVSSSALSVHGSAAVQRQPCRFFPAVVSQDPRRVFTRRRRARCCCPPPTAPDHRRARAEGVAAALNEPFKPGATAAAIEVSGDRRRWCGPAARSRWCAPPRKTPPATPSPGTRS